MRAVFISFLIFMASMVILLPTFNIGSQFIPADVLKFVPLLVMGLAMLSQWNALLDYKNSLDLKKAILAKSQDESQLGSELSRRDALLAEKTKELQSLQSKHEALLQENLREKERTSTEIKALKESVQKAHATLSETEKKLQASLDESGRLRNQPSSSDVLTFLSLLQEKGRFLDFLMDEITLYTDAQVGAAGRVVHQGCSKVLSEFFNISPLHLDDEGTVITLRKEDSMLAYRVIGKSFEDTPFDAKILHRGWGTDKVNIPRRSVSQVDVKGKLLISPVEVEVRG